MRITLNHLKKAVNSLREYGHYELSEQNGGVSMVQITHDGHGSGEKTIFHTTTKRELYNQIYAFRYGIEVGLKRAK